MKHLCFILISLCLFEMQLTAQKMGFNKSQSSTFAVVIGISDYSDEAIPDLRFANRDAEAFVNYLKSNAGDNVPEDNIKLLINNMATTARVAAAMDWLVESCGEGDKAVIYFSGHGDVETKTAMQHGFLLTHDSPPTTYIAGAYPLFYLQSIISTLSIQNKSQVFMFMDACHAGKLAGSAVGGVEATSSILAKQFANETKVLSCQPNEFSLEGEQWGNGRGVFSYHLIQGLTGLADRNEDYQVNVLELERYLEDKVSMEAAPNSQIPMTVGIKSNVIAFVDDVELQKLQIENQSASSMMAMVDSKGFEDGILKQIDSSIVEQYMLFKKELSQQPLMIVNHNNKIKPSRNHTADEIYKELIKVEVLKPLHNTMTRNLVVALQEKAQIAINSFLKIRNQKLSDNLQSISDELDSNKTFAVYLNRAAELLGENHYMYNDLISKSKYFEGLFFYHQSKNSDNNRKDWVAKSLKSLEYALKIVPIAPHILVELAWINGELQNYEKALSYAIKASELSPQWPIPYSSLSNIYFNDSNYEQSSYYALKALELQPEYEEALFQLTQAYSKLGRAEEIIKISEAYLIKYPNNLAAYLELSYAYSETDQEDKAIKTIKRAIEIDSQNAMAYQTLGNLYFGTGDHEKAISAFDTSIQLDPNEAFTYLLRIFLLLDTDKFDQAKKECIALYKKFPSDYEIMSFLAIIYLQNNENDKAYKLIQNVDEIIKNYDLNIFCQFCYHFKQGKKELAYEWLEKGLEKYQIGFLEDNMFQMSNCFQDALQSEKFQELISKYNEKQ